MDKRITISVEKSVRPFSAFEATALRGRAFLQTGGTPQVMAERQGNFHKDDDVRWQPSGARATSKGGPQGERRGVHQFGAPPMTALRGSAFPETEVSPQVASAAKNNMVGLPGQLFYGNQIPVCLRVLAKNKNA